MIPCRLNHENTAALQCPQTCLVSVTVRNGTSVGYLAPSTCSGFAATVRFASDRLP